MKAKSLEKRKKQERLNGGATLPAMVEEEDKQRLSSAQVALMGYKDKKKDFTSMT